MKVLILFDLLFKYKHSKDVLKKVGDQGVLANSFLILKTIILQIMKLKLNIG